MFIYCNKYNFAKFERGICFMKRILSLGLALLVVSASLLSLTACSSSSGEEVEVQTQTAHVGKYAWQVVLNSPV
jgi:hypothetical protein